MPVLFLYLDASLYTSQQYHEIKYMVFLLEENVLFAEVVCIPTVDFND